VEMMSADLNQQLSKSDSLLKNLFLVLAALTSLEQTCRSKVINKKKVLEELLIGIKST
jgi:hypothetical protein